MMKVIFFCLLVLTLKGSRAQTETEIRNHYQEINKKITESKEQGFEGSLYCNEWTTNKNGKSWRAVGRYEETTEFWYTDDPNHLPAAERNPKTVLQKVNIKRKSASLQVQEEFLFKNGRLVFYYSREGEEGNGWETRLYFNAKGLFKSSVKANDKELTAKDFSNPEYKDFKPDGPAVLKRAAGLQELFVKSM
jgi:hypothetical protein